jgi:hypothetical protein
MNLSQRSVLHPLLVLVGITPLTVFFTGCGIGTLAPSTPPVVAVSGVNITGTVFGGQQPIAGAHVYLYGVSPTSKTKAGSSVSLFGAGDASGGLSNGNSANSQGYGVDNSGNYYVRTAADGSFTFNAKSGFSNLYNCQGDDLIYALALGGPAGLPPSVKSQTALLAILGTGCPDGSLPTTLKVNLNEVSTVAAAYALAGYMSSAQTTAETVVVSNDTSTLATTGLINAGNNAGQLVDLASGSALATTPHGNGTVSPAKLNTIANMLASCVNTAGPTSSGCTTLFANATSDGTISGTKPTDTLNAALNIAHNPTANVATLINLSTPVAAFQPTLPNANDLTISISYPAGGLSTPGIPAIDASGDVWFPSQVSVSNPANPNGPQVFPATEVSPLGETITTAYLPSQPLQAVIDLNNTPWFALKNSGTVGHVSANGSVSAFPFNGASTDDGHQITVDQTGKVYVLDFTNKSIYKLSNAGAVTTSSASNSIRTAVGMFNKLAIVDAFVLRGITTLEPLVDSGASLSQDLPECKNCQGSGLTSPLHWQGTARLSSGL